MSVAFSLRGLPQRPQAEVCGSCRDRPIIPYHLRTTPAADFIPVNNTRPEKAHVFHIIKNEQNEELVHQTCRECAFRIIFSANRKCPFCVSTSCLGWDLSDDTIDLLLEELLPKVRSGYVLDLDLEAAIGYAAMRTADSGRDYVQEMLKSGGDSLSKNGFLRVLYTAVMKKNNECVREFLKFATSMTPYASRLRPMVDSAARKHLGSSTVDAFLRGDVADVLVYRDQRDDDHVSNVMAIGVLTTGVVLAVGLSAPSGLIAGVFTAAEVINLAVNGTRSLSTTNVLVTVLGVNFHSPWHKPSWRKVTVMTLARVAAGAALGAVTGMPLLKSAASAFGVFSLQVAGATLGAILGQLISRKV